MKGKPTRKAEPVIQPPPPKEESAAHRPPGGGETKSARDALGTQRVEKPGFKHLLVAVDFSESAFHALDYATALAARFQAELTLLHVVEPTVYAPNVLLAAAPIDDLSQTLLSSARERLKKLKHRAANLGLVTESLVRMGRAQSDITDTAKAIGADLIVLGAHSRNGARSFLLGGTAERVLRHSACPVLVVPPAGAIGF